MERSSSSPFLSMGFFQIPDPAPASPHFVAGSDVGVEWRQHKCHHSFCGVHLEPRRRGQRDRAVADYVNGFSMAELPLRRHADDGRPATRQAEHVLDHESEWSGHEDMMPARDLLIETRRGGGRQREPVDSSTVPSMVSVDEAARMALNLPEVAEGERHGNRTWSVAGKAFAWERPFSKADIRRFGDSSPPDGPILAVRVADLGEKEAVLAAQPKGFFTIPHFDGYPAVLLQLKSVTKRALREAVIDGWLACAPPKRANEYIAQEAARRQ
jgi:hypothetical protein